MVFLDFLGYPRGRDYYSTWAGRHDEAQLSRLTWRACAWHLELWTVGLWNGPGWEGVGIMADQIGLGSGGPDVLSSLLQSGKAQVGSRRGYGG